MVLKKRIICLLLAVITVLGCFSGCGVIKGDTVMEYDGYKITEAMYSYWMARYKTLFLYAYNNSNDTEKFWDTEIEEGYTYEQFIVEYINFYAKQVLVAMKLFDDYSLVFSDAVKKEITSQINDLIYSYDTKSALNAYLANYGINVETLEHIYYAQAKLDAVNEYLYGENGISKVTDSEMEKYYEDNYFCADWIYVYTKVKLKKNEDGEYITDSNGVYVTEDLTEEEQKKQQEKVDMIMEKLTNGEDFQTVKKKYTEEDVGKYDYYPDGVFLSANDYETYGTEFIKTVMALEVGEYAKYEDDYATFIVKRNELKEFSKLSAQEFNLMKDFLVYVLDAKAEAYYRSIEVNTYPEVMGRFNIRELDGITNTSI